MPQFVSRLGQPLIAFSAVTALLLFSGYALINTDHYSIWLLIAVSILLSCSLYRFPSLFSGTIAASITCLILYLVFLHSIRWNTEGFLCEGPLTPLLYDSQVEKDAVNHVLPYRAGFLISGNISDSRSVFIGYTEDPEFESASWVYLLDPSSESDFLIRKLEPVEIRSGILRDRLVFKYLNQHGHQAGYLHLWKFGGPHHYCLGYLGI